MLVDTLQPRHWELKVPATPQPARPSSSMATGHAHSSGNAEGPGDTDGLTKNQRKKAKRKAKKKAGGGAVGGRLLCVAGTWGGRGCCQLASFIEAGPAAAWPLARYSSGNAGRVLRMRS